MYSGAKTHNDNLPWSPIIDYTHMISYKSSGEFGDLRIPLAGKDTHHTHTSQDLVKEMLDVVSRFTKTAITKVRLAELDYKMTRH